MEINKIYNGEALQVLRTLPDNSIDMIMTSPPYWALRNYEVEYQLGLEKTPEEYIDRLCNIFDECKRVLKNQGTCWINIGDTYLHKCLSQIPSKLSIEMCNRGWILRNEIIWHKSNCMPSSVNDRFTIDFEKIYFFVKDREYYFEQQFENSSNKSEMDYRRVLRRKNADKYLMKKPYANNFPKSFRSDGKRNKRSVWNISTKPFKGAHFAVYPEDLCIIPINAGCPENGIVLDPFFGAGTTGVVAKKLNRNYIGIELNPEYIKIAQNRINKILI